MLRRTALPVALIILALMVGVGAVQAFENARPAAAPVGTSFTYQGFLEDSDSPADGAYDLQFRLFNDPDTGSQVGSTLTEGDVAVAAGVFTVELDFGAVFNGTALWLEIWVRPGASSGGYTQLLPRQPLTPTPYALYASHIPLAGSGVAETAARSDHTHLEYLTEEVDPHIGDISQAGKLCQSNGLFINCDVTGPQTITKYVQLGPPDIYNTARAVGLALSTHGVANVQFDPATQGAFYVPTHVPTGTTMTGAYCFVKDDVGSTISLSVYNGANQCGSTVVSTGAGSQDLLISDCNLSVTSTSRGTPLYFDIDTASTSRYLYYCWVRYTYTGIQ